MTRIPGTLIDPTCINVVNYSIQGFDLPGLQYQPIVQYDLGGYDENHRANVAAMRLKDSNVLTITFELFDGAINYFILRDAFMYWYQKDYNEFLPEAPGLFIYDGEGIAVTKVAFSDVIMTGISGMQMSRSTNTLTFNTFTCSFVFNGFDILPVNQ